MLDVKRLLTKILARITYKGEYILLADNQDPADSGGTLTLATSYKNCIPTNKYSTYKSPLADDLFSVSGGVVTINKAGRYKVDYQVLVYQNFTTNDQLWVSVMVNGSASNTRASRLRAYQTNPTSTCSGWAYLNLSDLDTIGLSAINTTAARGNIALNALTRMSIECLAIYE